VTESDVW